MTTGTFSEKFAHLIALGEIDQALHTISRKIKVLPEQVAEAREAFERVKLELDRLEGELLQLKKSRDMDELEVNALIQRVAEREKRLYAIKTQKEYQAALKEVADSKKQKREREDRVLEQMEKIEGLSQKIQQLQGEYSDKEVRYNEELSKMQAEEAELKREAAALESQRSEAGGRVPPKLFRA